MTLAPKRGDGGWTRVLVTVAMGVATIISTWALASRTASKAADHEMLGRVENLEKIDASQATEIGLSTRYREMHQQETQRMYSELKAEVATLKEGQRQILEIVQRLDRRTAH